MKKLLFLLLIGSIALTTTAQRGYNNRRFDDRFDRYDKDYDNYKHGSKHNKKEMKRQMAIINHDFDSRISDIRRSRFLRSQERNRRIAILENQRSLALRDCQSRYSNGRNRGFAETRPYRGNKW